MDIEKLLKQAYELAQKSPDPSNQNGALVVDYMGNILSTGYNNFPNKIKITPDLLQNRDKKLFYIEHAEREAIYNCANNQSTGGHILICPWFASADCGRAIIFCGITKVIGHKQRMDTTPDRWKESIKAAETMMKAHGVEIQYLDKKLDGPSIIVNGKLWTP